MNKILGLLRRDRLYLVLLIFVMLVNIVSMVPAESRAKAKSRCVGAKISMEDMARQQNRIEKLFYEDRSLALRFSLVFLLFISLLFLGITIDALLISSRLAARRLDICTYRTGKAMWGMWDVSKTVILFFLAKLTSSSTGFHNWDKNNCFKVFFFCCAGIIQINFN